MTQWWATAHAVFQTMIAHGSRLGTLDCLELVGLAVLDHSSDPEVPGELASLFAEHPELVGGAMSVVGTLEDIRDPSTLLTCLYARSGYQVLVDAGVWLESPVLNETLEEEDEELLQVVAEVPLGGGRPLPRSVPAGHVWWPPSVARRDT